MFDSRLVTSKSWKMSPRISKQRPPGCSAACRMSPSCARYRIIRMRRLVGEVRDGSKSRGVAGDAFQRLLLRLRKVWRLNWRLKRRLGGCFRVHRFKRRFWIWLWPFENDLADLIGVGIRGHLSFGFTR